MNNIGKNSASNKRKRTYFFQKQNSMKVNNKNLKNLSQPRNAKRWKFLVKNL